MQLCVLEHSSGCASRTVYMCVKCDQVSRLEEYYSGPHMSTREGIQTKYHAAPYCASFLCHLQTNSKLGAQYKLFLKLWIHRSVQLAEVALIITPSMYTLSSAKIPTVDPRLSPWIVRRVR